MAAVRSMTGLTDRQIRYYEENGLIKPLRTRGKQRIFTEREVAILKEVKEHFDQGWTMEAIKGAMMPEEPAMIAYSPLEPAKTLPGMRRGLTSLYPVSDRAQLVDMILRRRREQAKQQQNDHTISEE
jgi:MerR family glutamine synthetase transcriptional repressor